MDLKKFYQDNKKPILFFAGFIIFVLLAVTVINGDMGNVVTN